MDRARNRSQFSDTRSQFWDQPSVFKLGVHQQEEFLCLLAWLMNLEKSRFCQSGGGNYLELEARAKVATPRRRTPTRAGAWCRRKYARRAHCRYTCRVRWI